MRRRSEFDAANLLIAAFFAVAGVLYLLFRLARWGWHRYIAWRSEHDEEFRRRRLLMLRGSELAVMTPVGFEMHCAQVLQSQGWICCATRASGDFGVDVLAERQGRRVAIQVKKWRSRVDLSAVQQAATGAAMYGASAAAVVSVSGYQASAVRLARANRVLLLSYNDLFDFTRRGPSARR